MELPTICLTSYGQSNTWEINWASVAQAIIDNIHTDYDSFYEKTNVYVSVLLADN